MTHCCDKEKKEVEHKEETVAKEKSNYTLIAVLALLLIVSVFQAAQLSGATSRTQSVPTTTGLATADPMASHHSGQQSAGPTMVGGC